MADPNALAQMAKLARILDTQIATRPVATRPDAAKNRFVPGRIGASQHVEARRDTPKIGRNEPCACGSRKKAKKCCLK